MPAAAALRRALAKEPNRLTRARLLAAQVEVALPGFDLETATAAAGELRGSPSLRKRGAKGRRRLG